VLKVPVVSALESSIRLTAVKFFFQSQCAPLHLVVDNAGFELVCDLALADAIVCGTRAGSDSSATVTLHVKAHPTFVSDAMVGRCRMTL
jgi:hypothetical protein